MMLRCQAVSNNAGSLFILTWGVGTSPAVAVTRCIASQGWLLLPDCIDDLANCTRCTQSGSERGPLTMLSCLFTAIRRSLMASSNEVCSSSSLSGWFAGTVVISGIVANRSSTMEVIETPQVCSSDSAIRHCVYMICNSFLINYSLYALA